MFRQKEFGIKHKFRLKEFRIIHNFRQKEFGFKHKLRAKEALSPSRNLQTILITYGRVKLRNY